MQTSSLRHVRYQLKKITMVETLAIFCVVKINIRVRDLEIDKSLTKKMQNYQLCRAH